MGCIQNNVVLWESSSALQFNQIRFSVKVSWESVVRLSCCVCRRNAPQMVTFAEPTGEVSGTVFWLAEPLPPLSLSGFLASFFFICLHWMFAGRFTASFHIHDPYCFHFITVCSCCGVSKLCFYFKFSFLHLRTFPVTVCQGMKTVCLNKWQFFMISLGWPPTDHSKKVCR